MSLHRQCCCGGPPNNRIKLTDLQTFGVSASFFDSYGSGSEGVEIWTSTNKQPGYVSVAVGQSDDYTATCMGLIKNSCIVGGYWYYPGIRFDFAARYSGWVGKTVIVDIGCTGYLGGGQDFEGIVPCRSNLNYCRASYTSQTVNEYFYSHNCVTYPTCPLDTQEHFDLSQQRIVVQPAWDPWITGNLGTIKVQREGAPASGECFLECTLSFSFAP